MKKFHLGLLLGACAGVVDVAPMIAQGLSWDANISAFVFWVVAGFFIATSSLKIKFLNGALKGVIISLLTLLSVVILVGWKTPMSLIPMVIMTIILGSILGFLIEKHGK